MAWLSETRRFRCPSCLVSIFFFIIPRKPQHVPYIYADVQTAGECRILRLERFAVFQRAWRGF